VLSCDSAICELSQYIDHQPPKPPSRPRLPHQNFLDFSNSLEKTIYFYFLQIIENTRNITNITLIFRFCGVKVSKIQVEREGSLGGWWVMPSTGLSEKDALSNDFIIINVTGLQSNADGHNDKVKAFLSQIVLRTVQGRLHLSSSSSSTAMSRPIVFPQVRQTNRASPIQPNSISRFLAHRVASTDKASHGAKPLSTIA
jgi:hypothetical protein